MGKLITMKVLVVGMKGAGIETGEIHRCMESGCHRRLPAQSGQMALCRVLAMRL
jgi:hypothetical protein